MRHFFEEQFEKYERSLFLVALAYLHNTEDAKDIVQEAALAAYLSMDKLRHPEYFKTWITRIVINKSKNFLKSRRPSKNLDDAINIFCGLPTEELELMDAICRLDPALSMYISLRYYNEMTYEQAAKVLKQPVSTVKYKTAKALSELKKALEGEMYR